MNFLFLIFDYQLLMINYQLFIFHFFTYFFLCFYICSCLKLNSVYIYVLNHLQQRWYIILTFFSPVSVFNFVWYLWPVIFFPLHFYSSSQLTKLKWCDLTEAEKFLLECSIVTSASKFNGRDVATLLGDGQTD